MKATLRRKRRWDRSLVVLVVIVLVVAATLVLGYLQLRTDLVTEASKKGQPINVMFALAGDSPERFFEVLMIDPRTHRGAVIFIPGNVGLIIESLKKVDRIDALYSPRDLSALKEKVEEITGLSIPFTVDLSQNAVVRLVDLLGGLELFIPNPVDITYQDRRILLPSGSVVLDGEKIRDFITYRDALESEMDWVGRKQRFLQSLLKRLGEEQVVLNPKVFPVLRETLSTNLRPRALRALLQEIERLDTETIVFQRVLGSTRNVDGQELLFPHFEGALLKETIKQTQETLASQEPGAAEDLNIVLEILNGTTVTGLARRAANVFQSFGYEVVSVGNAESQDYQKTVVLDRRGRPEAARRAAELIRCATVRSEPPGAAEASVDVTVVLGKDFDGRYCQD